MAEQLNINALAVDDSELIRQFLFKLLSDNGSKVKTAADAHQALETLKQFEADVILLDFNMPGMDGFQMLRQLQADPDLGRIPVVILTGKSMDESTQRLIEMEPNVRKAFMKPIQPMRLLPVLKQIAKEKGKCADTTPTTIGEAASDPSGAPAYDPYAFEGNLRTIDLSDLSKPRPAEKPKDKP